MNDKFIAFLHLYLIFRIWAFQTTLAVSHVRIRACAIGARNRNSDLSNHLLPYVLCIRVAKALAKMLAVLVLKFRVLAQ